MVVKKPTQFDMFEEFTYEASPFVMSLRMQYAIGKEVSETEKWLNG